MVSNKTNSAHSLVTLPLSLTIDTVENFLSGLATLEFGSPSNVTLDASALETLTTPGIQLLIALHKSAERGEGRMTIAGLQPAVRDTCAQFGISDWIQSWCEAAEVLSDSKHTKGDSGE